MFDNKDYSKLTLEELMSEEKTTKKGQIFFLLILVFLLCAVVYGIINKGIGSTNFFIPILFSWLVYRNSKNLKNIRAEIQIKNTK